MVSGLRVQGSWTRFNSLRLVMYDLYSATSLQQPLFEFSFHLCDFAKTGEKG